MNAEAVDEAGNTLGVIIDTSDGVIGKKGTTKISGKLDVMADIGGGLRKIERGQVKDGCEALVESLVSSEAQDTAQFRLPDEEK